MRTKALSLIRVGFCFGLLALLGGCATTPPSQPDNLCAVFKEKKGWYKAASRSQKKWGSPIGSMMAIMYQESSYRGKAKPPKRYFLGFIPAGRKSSAYGYAQVKDGTWSWYKNKTNSWGADRDDFADAIDFIGWYNNMSRRQSGIPLNEPYKQYLAYHEGHGGYNRGSYKKKAWLTGVARKVDHRAKRYQSQLMGCEKSLKRKRFLGIF